MILPLLESKYRILRLIYENPGIKISDIFKKTRVSTKAGYKYLNELLKAEAVLEAEERFPRKIYPNFHEGKIVFALIEKQKELDFFEKHREMKGAFRQFKNETKEKIQTALVFGSFARGTEEKDSDIDMIFIVKSKKSVTQINRIAEECFITLKNRVSARIVNETDFIEAARKKDSLYLNILKNHICFLNQLNFMDMMEKLQAS